MTTAANDLVQAGYGSCATNLNDVVAALESVYGYSGADLVTNLTSAAPRS